MSDTYLPGAAVLAKSLRDSGTTKKLAVLIDQERLRPSTVTELQSLYNYCIPIERIGNPNPANLYLMNRPDLLYTFTKINLWRMVQFRKIVYIDSDVVSLRAPDELFDTQETFAAAPDVGWPDAFNTGVMVLTPHMGDYWALRTQASAGDSFDGADQGLLNQYFEHKPWKRLSFAYNCTPGANYQYEPAYRYYKRDISMVHFIGKEKPWQQGRSVKGAPGAYQELLSRWWAVYDRHFRVSTSDYISGGREEPVSRAVQQEVKSKKESDDRGYYATGYPSESTQPAPPPTTPASPPKKPATTIEIPFTEPGEATENIDQGVVKPHPTTEMRRFSAPHMEWDATRAPPPVEAKPEAEDFPGGLGETYEFSTDPHPFRPPPSYPEPPKDMWYEVPKEKPKEEKLAPIFPWEERERPEPARRFVEDEPLPISPEPEPEPDFAGADELEVRSDDRDVGPRTPARQANTRTSLQTLGAASKNAWDEISGIEDYVRALTASQRNRGKVQVLQNQTSPQPVQQHILSPSNEPLAADLIEKVQKRRESLILTDFPTAVERPSLPVTPAPRRRSNFWGVERDQEAEMPGAKGVPDQADWDPSAQLEQLRRASLVGPGELKMPDRKALPERKMVSTAGPVMEEAPKEPHRPMSGRSSPQGSVDPPTPKPILKKGPKSPTKGAVAVSVPGSGAGSPGPVSSPAAGAAAA
ncbi:glycogenin glucosyltransferase [Vermiconidia calcicola]|uniref:Glycogenin glucosyltransferase n=1 Tax=Vermiconidia calcicola TaxID=1690605 RepID=A0ACC3MKC9_9PEZI|nr:glycogenin glucosyltransferase [Vermiconidia calcicola]